MGSASHHHGTEGEAPPTVGWQRPGSTHAPGSPKESAAGGVGGTGRGRAEGAYWRHGARLPLPAPRQDPRATVLGEVRASTWAIGASWTSWAGLPFADRYNSAGNITAKNGSNYSYDLMNRLLTASEKGRFVSDSRSEAKPIGTVQDDYAGDSTLSFSGEDIEIAFDSASMSLGVDLGGSREVSRIEISPRQASHRVTASAIDVLTSDDNKGSWTAQKDCAVSLEADGSIVISFTNRPRAQFIKLHCRFDDRDEDGQATIALATFLNLRSAIISVTFFNEERDDSYSYDEKGNRKTLSSRAGSLTTTSDYSYYPNTDRLKSDGKYGYAYDANGNLTEKAQIFTGGDSLSFSADQGEYWRYEYDLQNRLVRVLKGIAGSTSAVEAASYRYAADGLRLAKTKDGASTYFVYGIDGNLLSCLPAEGSSDTIWLFGKKFAEVSTIEALSATTTTTFLATDHLGTVVAATDETGKVIWKGDLTAFGQEVGQSGIAARIASFTGKDFDEDAGRYYFNARWYEADTGRFTTEDPIRDAANWYVYCANNPMTRFDPTGLEDDDPNDYGPDPQYWPEDIKNDPGKAAEAAEHAAKNKALNEGILDRATKWSQRPKESYPQQTLLAGTSACHFMSLVMLAQKAAGFNFSFFELLDIYTKSLAANAMDSEYSVTIPGRDTILGLAFLEANMTQKRPFTSPFKIDGLPIMGTILRGKQFWPQNRRMAENGASPVKGYHFEAGNADASLYKDPWGYRLEKYEPYKEYYYAYW